MSVGNKFLITAVILFTIMTVYHVAPITAVMMLIGLLVAAYFAVHSNR